MFEIFALAGLLCVGGAIVESIKEKAEPEIPAENWANQDLKHEDIMNGVPMDQIIKNARAGRYKVTEKHPEPHRDKDGRIMIENCLLYDRDCEIYSPQMIQKMAERGRYNLTPEELEVERKRLDEKYERLYRY